MDADELQRLLDERLEQLERLSQLPTPLRLAATPLRRRYRDDIRRCRRRLSIARIVARA